MFLVSVVVPIYNVEKYLVQCIQTILYQSYRNLEVILVDDGSPDNCGKICDEFAIKDKRIKVIHKNNGGLSDARNVGIDKAMGEYITFIDSDDYIMPDMIESLMNTIIKERVDIAQCTFVQCVSDDVESINPGLPKCSEYTVYSENKMSAYLNEKK